MNLLDSFGRGRDEELLARGNRTEGIITEVKTLWFLKVNTKAFRKGPLDGAAFPHRIVFRYTAGGKDHTGSRVLPPSENAPTVGEPITVFYDPDEPEHCAIQGGAL